MRFTLTGCIAVVAVAAILPTGAWGAIPSSERDALFSIYNSTGGPTWTNRTNWGGVVGTECTWYGVTCDAGQTHVIGLNLRRNNLAGAVPTGLQSLPSLATLNLSYNPSLTGGLPSWLGNLTSLTYLNLSTNKGLSGPIPASIGNLVNLVTLDLGNSNYTGDMSWVPSLTKLQNLVLYDNQISGPIPPTIGNLTSLEKLFLSANNLSGGIPASLGNLVNLWRLSLDMNPLGGTIPTSLGNLTNLTMLELGACQLAGPLPSSMGNLTKLSSLSLAGNPIGGAIPSWIGNLTQLAYLDLSRVQLTGVIPLQLTTLTKLTGLYLQGNLLTGSIPPQIGSLANLQSLDLGANQLSGAIPPQLGNLSALGWLHLQGNMLSGSIPTQLASLTALSAGWLDLRWNTLYSTSSTLTTFLNGKQTGGDWQSTQTIAPVSPSVAGSTGTTVTLSWTPIAYTADTGGYRVYRGTAAGGPYALAVTTATKADSTATVTGLTAGTRYYFVLDTFTNPHTFNTNTVVSGRTAEISAVPGGGTAVVTMEAPSEGDVAGLVPVRARVTPPAGQSLTEMTFYSGTTAIASCVSGVCRTPATVVVGSCSGNTCSITWDVVGIAAGSAPKLKASAIASGGATGTSGEVPVTVRPLISGQLSVVDQSDPYNPDRRWNIDRVPQDLSPGSTVKLGQLEMVVRHDGTFSSRQVLGPATERSVTSATRQAQASIMYRDTVISNWHPVHSSNGCDGGQILRTSRISAWVSVSQGSPAVIQIGFPLPIALVHGIRSCWQGWEEWIDDLTAAGHLVFTPNHHYRGWSKEDEALEIVDQLNLGLGALFSTAPRFFYVGHSEGGVVGRVVASNAIAKRIPRFYTVGTPHSGTNVPLVELGAGIGYGLDEDTMQLGFNRVYPNFRSTADRVVAGDGDVYALGGRLPLCLGTDCIVAPQSSVFSIVSRPLVPFSEFFESTTQAFDRAPERQHEFPWAHTSLTSQKTVCPILQNTILRHMAKEALPADPMGGCPAGDGPTAATAGDRSFRPGRGGFEGSLGTPSGAPPALDTGASRAVVFLVSATDLARFFCTPEEGVEASCLLVRPDGRVVRPEALHLHPDVEYVKNEFGEEYSVASPEAGNWTLRVEAAGVGGEVYAGASETSQFELQAGASQTHYAGGESMTLVARVAGERSGVAVAAVNATVASAAGDPVSTFELLDDGAHGDGAAGDGVYANSLAAPSAPGLYRVEVSATGTNQGLPFLRTARTRFDVRDVAFTGIFGDVAADTDADALLDTIRFTAELEIPAGGEYVLSADLVDSDGYPVDHVTATLDLASSGPAQATLSFSAARVACSQFGRPFIVKDLVLVASDQHYRIVDAWPSPVPTATYAGASFGCGANAEPSPVVVAVGPDGGTPGRSVTAEVSGSGFQEGAVVRFGAYADGITTTRLAPGLLRATWAIPAGAPAGAVDVTVVNPDGRSGSLPLGFTLSLDRAPTIAIAYPVAGQVVAGVLTVSASASDDQGLQRVEFLVDGLPAGTDTTYPYQLEWSAESAGLGPHVLRALAYDTIGQAAQAEVSVEVAPPSLFVENTSVQEEAGGRSVTVDVGLVGRSANTVTVEYATADGSAVAGQDYDAASGTLTFPPGVVQQQLTVDVLGDGEGEPTETFFVDASSPVNAILGGGRATVSILDEGASGFYPLTPCRLVDTRWAIGALGGPALAAGQARTFTLAGECGVPATARALSVNLTVTQPTTGGHLRVYPAGAARPTASAVNYAIGQTRANNAVVRVGPDAGLTVYCGQPSGGTHFILDVNGYLR